MPFKKQYNEYRIEGQVVFLICDSKAYGYHEIKIDLEDFDRVYKEGKWSLAKFGEASGHYAVKRKGIRLHRFILNMDKSNKDDKFAYLTGDEDFEFSDDENNTINNITDFNKHEKFNK